MTSNQTAAENDAAPLSETVVIAELVGIYGVKGWLKVKSHTSPKENFLQYQQCWLRHQGQTRRVEIDASRTQGKGIIAHFVGLDDRDEARTWVGAELLIEADSLPQLDDEEFYWHQLVGLAVTSEFGGVETPLGEVRHLLETGANDVLVVKGEDRERLIPWIPDQVILKVDLPERQITVDWDPEF